MRQQFFALAVSIVGLSALAETPAATLSSHPVKPGDAEGREICGLKTGDTLMFMGDSITVFGEAWNGGYVRLVMSALEKLGVEPVKNVNAGCGYQSPTFVSHCLPRIKEARPKVMTFSCGVNDVLHTYSPPGPGRHGTDLEPYKKNVAKIFDEADKYGVKVIVLTTTMLREDETNAMNRAIVPYNDFLRAEAARRGYLLADVNKAHHEGLRKIKKGDRDKGWLACYDGIHMGELGNKMMATEILKAMGLTKADFAKVDEAWKRMRCERPYGQLVTTTTYPGGCVTVNGGNWSWGYPSAEMDGKKLPSKHVTPVNFTFQMPTNAVPGLKQFVILGANGQRSKPLTIEVKPIKDNQK